MKSAVESSPRQFSLGGDPIKNIATDGPHLGIIEGGNTTRLATYGRRATLDNMMVPTDPSVLHGGGLSIQQGEKLSFIFIGSSAGGNEVNAGLDAARQGINTTIYTVAGEDAVGDAIGAELQRTSELPNIDLNYKLRRQGKSRISTIIYNPGEDRRVLSGSPGDKMADTGVHFEDLKDTVDDHDYFYFTYMGQGFGEVVDKVKSQEKPYSMSLNSVDLSEIGPHHFEAINGADILFANLNEAEKITHTATDLDFIAATGAEFNEKHFEGLYETLDEERKKLINKNMFMQLHKFKALGVNWGSITDGENGAYLIDENSTIMHIEPFNYHLPTEDRELVNTLGAGDAFVSGVITARARGQSAEEAMRQGAIMSDKTIKEVGPHDGKTDFDDMVYTSWRFLKDFKPSVLFEKPYVEEEIVIDTDQQNIDFTGISTTVYRYPFTPPTPPK